MACLNTHEDPSCLCVSRVCEQSAELLICPASCPTAYTSQRLTCCADAAQAMLHSSQHLHQHHRVLPVSHGSSFQSPTYMASDCTFNHTITAQTGNAHVHNYAHLPLTRLILGCSGMRASFLIFEPERTIRISRTMPQSMFGGYLEL